MYPSSSTRTYLHSPRIYRHQLVLLYCPGQLSPAPCAKVHNNKSTRPAYVYLFASMAPPFPVEPCRQSPRMPCPVLPCPALLCTVFYCTVLYHGHDGRYIQLGGHTFSIIRHPMRVNFHEVVNLGCDGGRWKSHQSLPAAVYPQPWCEPVRAISRSTCGASGDFVVTTD